MDVGNPRQRTESHSIALAGNGPIAPSIHQRRSSLTPLPLPKRTQKIRVAPPSRATTGSSSSAPAIPSKEASPRAALSLSKAHSYATFKGKPGAREIRDRHRVPSRTFLEQTTGESLVVSTGVGTEAGLGMDGRDGDLYEGRGKENIHGTGQLFKGGKASWGKSSCQLAAALIEAPGHICAANVNYHVNTMVQEGKVDSFGLFR